jgi:hypothetical protein
MLFVCRNLMITMLLGGLWHGAARRRAVRQQAVARGAKALSSAN